MVPNTILRQLARLRFRERCLRIAWGATLLVTIAVIVMAVCCLADWLIDRYQDTPMSVRRGMFVGQVALWLTAAAAFLVWAFLRRMSDDALALYVEDKVPAFGHRLISALQLNRPDANIKGMSPALIAAATNQAEEHAAKQNFRALADHRRLERCAQLLFGIGLLVAPLLIFAYDTTLVLVHRQFLADREIPRTVSLVSVSPTVWPAGEDVELKFLVRGPGLSGNLQGDVQIDPKGGSPERYPLVLAERKGGTEAIFTATVRANTLSYDYRAWLRDGRTRKPAHMQIEPRPAIVKQDAWVQLPAYVGHRPNGQLYEMHQPRGDIAGLMGANARVVVEAQKPIARATIELLGRPMPELLAGMPMPAIDALGVPLASIHNWLVPVMVFASPEMSGPGAGPGPELVKRRFAMNLHEDDRQRADILFSLQPGESIYRILVEDQYGFVNLDAPRRNIRLDAEEPPIVALLPERFPEPGQISSEDDEFEGVPVLHKGRFRFAYTTSSPFGLGKAQMRYRLNGEGEWWPLPLKEVPGNVKYGPFDLKNGAFVNSGFLDSIEFHKMPSPDIERFPAGTEGGGRYDFLTKELPVKVGDKIEFYVEVFDRNPDDTRAPGRSEVREKTIVDFDTYKAWKDGVQQEESRIRQLENKQRNVFGNAVVDERPTGTGTKPVKPSITPANPINGFIRSWQVIGPFPSDNDGKGFDVAYPPEKKVELGKDVDAGNAKLRWKVLHSTSDYIDLERFLKHGDAGVAYAVCWFRATDDAKAILSTGSDDGIKVWLDHKEVLSKKARRDAVKGEDKTPIKIVENHWYELLVKVDNRATTWGFYFEFLDALTNRPLEGLQFRTSPPGDDARRFVRTWQLIGPFPNVGDNGRDVIHLPETDKVALDKEYDGIGGKVKWKEHKSPSIRIGLDQFFERNFNESNLAYGVCWIKVPEGKERVTVATGSDDGIKVWVNRKLRIDAGVSRDAEPGKDVQDVKLEKGWNEVLVKVDNRFGRWAYFLEVRDPDTEQALDGLEVRNTPPEE